MTKSEAAAAKARCDTALFTLGSEFSSTEFAVTRDLLADRAALIEALRPFAEAWDAGFLEVPDLGPTAEKASLLLRSFGEITK